MATTPDNPNSSRNIFANRSGPRLIGGKFLRRGLIALTGLVTLIAAFYTVENWRGYRAWESYKRDMAVHNLPTDWTPPKPLNIPDDQNFTQTPLLKAIGIKGQVDTNVWRRFDALHLNGLFANQGEAGKLTDLAADQQELRGLPEVSLPPLPRDPALDVLDYLRALEPEMNELRQASFRPKSAFIIQGNDPVALDIPNFVGARTLARLFSLQASAELALGKPAAAFRDQFVVHRLAEAMKSSDTLVATMIRVAMLGLNAQTFWEGWAREQWTESQWLELQTQYHEIDLLADLDRSFRVGELGAVNHILNHFSRAQLAKVFSNNGRSAEFDPLAWLIRVAPRGWVRQNQVVYNQLMTLSMLDFFDASQQRIYPKKQVDNIRKLETAINKATPYNVIAGMAVPNFVRAAQVAAHNQTQAKQAELVCALERYRLKNGNYPATLQTLAPDFIETLPHDLITGDPFQYRRQANGQFLLYSVGWNEKDDGGVMAINPQGQPVADEGDWVWPAKPELK